MNYYNEVNVNVCIISDKRSRGNRHSNEGAPLPYLMSIWDLQWCFVKLINHVKSNSCDSTRHCSSQSSDL